MKGPYWVKQWITNLAMLNEQFRNEDGSVDFEALGREEYAFRTAIITRKFEKSPRAKEVFDEAMDTYRTNSERAQKGGIAKGKRTGGDSVRRVGVASPEVCHKSAGAPVRNSGRRFRNKEEYMQWAIDSGLDATDASECWDATLERGGKDADGNKVVNIKAFAKRWCRTRAENRRTA